MREGEPVHSFEVKDPIRCHGCDAKLKAQDEHAKRGKVVREPALYWVVEQTS